MAGEAPGGRHYRPRALAGPGGEEEVLRGEAGPVHLLQVELLLRSRGQFILLPPILDISLKIKTLPVFSKPFIWLFLITTSFLEPKSESQPPPGPFKISLSSVHGPLF